jgi:hypothetical protein
MNAVRAKRQKKAEIRNAHRIILFSRVVIFIASFVVALWLFSLADGLIEQYQYRRYHNMSE